MLLLLLLYYFPVLVAVSFRRVLFPDGFLAVGPAQVIFMNFSDFEVAVINILPALAVSWLIGCTCFFLGSAVVPRIPCPEIVACWGIRLKKEVPMLIEG